MISFSSKIPSNLMSEALDCRDRRVEDEALQRRRQAAEAVAPPSSYQSGLHSLGKLFIQGVHVVSLGRQLGAVFKLHLQTTHKKTRGCEQWTGYAATGGVPWLYWSNKHHTGGLLDLMLDLLTHMNLVFTYCDYQKMLCIESLICYSFDVIHLSAAPPGCALVKARPRPGRFMLFFSIKYLFRLLKCTTFMTFILIFTLSGQICCLLPSSINNPSL